MKDIRIKQAENPVEIDEAMKVRYEVFVKEQGFQPFEEFNPNDLEAIHLIAYDAAQAVGTVRMLQTPNYDVVGRLAVLQSYRKQGIGTLLTNAILEKTRSPLVVLHAQLPLIVFYEKFGFAIEGEIFYEGHLEHQKMVLKRNDNL